MDKHPISFYGGRGNGSRGRGNGSRVGVMGVEDWRYGNDKWKEVMKHSVINYVEEKWNSAKGVEEVGTK